MVNILLEGLDIDADWLKGTLKNYLKPYHKVVIVALSFGDEISNEEDWQREFNRRNGGYYKALLPGLLSYGISEDNISIINYFTDSTESAIQKVKHADVVYFLGGLPDRMYDRIVEMGLLDTFRNFNGIAMGFSAGALIQLSEYHLYPDQDYNDFGYYKGLGYIDDFYHEVHYTGTPVQDESIRRVIAQRNKTVYVTTLSKGAIVCDGGSVKLVGEVKTYNKSKVLPPIEV